MTDSPTRTPEQEDALLAESDEIRAKRAAAAQAALAERYAPLVAFRSSAAFAEVLAQAKALAPVFGDQPSVYLNLTGLTGVMEALDRVMPASMRAASQGI